MALICLAAQAGFERGPEGLQSPSAVVLLHAWVLQACSFGKGTNSGRSLVSNPGNISDNVF